MMNNSSWNKSRMIRFLNVFALVSVLAVTATFAAPAAAEDIESSNPDEISSLIKKAGKAARDGEFIEAEKLLRRAIELSPQRSAAKVELANILVKQRRFREAAELSFEVAEKEPKNSRAFAVLGLAVLNIGRFDDARKILYKAIDINGREDLAWASLGLLDFYENHMDESLKSLNQAVYLEPYEPDYWFAFGQVSARAENYKNAAYAYDKFLSVSGKTDADRRARIKGLIAFLRYLGQRSQLYAAGGGEQTTVPIRLLGNRPVIELKVNDVDRPLNFVLDTGSGISVISNDTARLLNIKPVARGGYAKGLGGDGKFEIVYGFIKRVSIGDVDIRNVPVYIRDFHSSSEEVDGYIGLSLIAKFLTTVDYGKLSFALQKRDSSPLSPAESVSLPLRLTSSGFLSGEVQLEGIENPLNFIVDTGASVSVISDSIAGLNGIKDLVQGEKMRVIGSAGITEGVPSFLLPRVSFGKHSRESITAIALDLDLINEASGFEQAGILGGNFLKNYRLTFDFQNSRVTFVPLTVEK